MKAEVLIDELSREIQKRFGPETWKECTPHHFQIRFKDAIHNIWKSKKNGVLVQYAGSRDSIKVMSANIILNTLATTAQQQHTRQAEELRQFTSFMRQSKQNGRDGVFVDAGFKDGRARVAMIFVEGEYMAAESFTLDNIKSPSEAEEAIIRYALQRHPNANVYSDCQPVVNKLARPNLFWLPREKNIADAFGNLRRGST